MKIIVQYCIKHLVNFLAEETDHENDDCIVIWGPFIERAEHEVVAERHQEHEISYLNKRCAIK